MKRFLLLLVLFTGLNFVANAQISLLAVLNHEGQISTYEGADALNKAYEAAEDGDIITLSGGIFTCSYKISKDITIKGAGMMPEKNPTIITDNITIETQSEGSSFIQIEGIFFSQKVTLSTNSNVKLLKCWFAEEVKGSTGGLNNLSVIFIDCFIMKEANFYTSVNSLSNLQFINCYAHQISGKSNSVRAYVQNCVVSSNPSYSTFSNSIYLGTMTGGDVTFYNSVVKTDGLINSSPENAGNIVMENIEDIFQEGTTTYQLKEEYATTLLGNDDTQVGMYGGAYPFSPTVSGLKITNFNIPAQTNSEGKLPVEITVEVQ